LLAESQELRRDILSRNEKRERELRKKKSIASRRSFSKKLASARIGRVASG